MVFIDAGDSEVGEFDGAITSNQHILWFDVAMNDAAAVSRSQAKRNIMGND